MLINNNFTIRKILYQLTFFKPNTKDTRLISRKMIADNLNLRVIVLALQVYRHKLRKITRYFNLGITVNNKYFRVLMYRNFKILK